MVLQQVIFLDSAGATDKDLATGQAHWVLQQPIGSIPRAQVGCSQFSFVNFFINISSALNNNHIFYSDDHTDLVKYDITIPDGSWSFNDLNAFIKAELISQNHGGTPGLPIFLLVANYATNQIGIQFSATDTNFLVHFGATSPYTLLGFHNPQSIPVGLHNTAYYLEMAPHQAAFNNITNLKVSTNLTTSSISNTNQSPIILTCVPTVSVGSTQTFEAQNVLFLDSTCLQDKITEIRVQIIDQNDVPVFLSENFTLTLLVQN